MTVTEPIVAGGPDNDAPRLSRAWLAVLVVFVLGVAGFIGYSIRANQDRTPQVSSGRAYIGLDMGSVIVDGMAYGFSVTENSMEWVDARGGQHEGGIPPCMQHRPGYARIRFGHTSAPAPDGSTLPIVTWVQCLPAR